ncbi:glycosyltransferase family 8 protein [Halovulum sp. GXIMD14793]
MGFANVLTSSGPAKHSNAIIFACDDTYMPYAVCAMQMLLEACPVRDFDIVICDTRPANLSQPLLDAGIRHCQLELGPEISAMDTKSHSAAETYIRLTLPSTFRDSYARIIYLDPDILIESGDLPRLFQADLKGKAFGAVRDTRQWRKPNRQSEEFRQYDLAPAPYFNSGVLLIDTEAWIEQSVTERALAVHTRNDGRLHRCHDQSLLNIAMYKDWAELSPVWNWQQSYQFDYLMFQVAPHIIHFVGSHKPWKEGSEAYLSARRRFAELLARFYPDHPSAQLTQRSGRPGFSQIAHRCLKTLTTARKVIHYLDRLPDDLTTHAVDKTS